MTRGFPALAFIGSESRMAVIQGYMSLLPICARPMSLSIAVNSPAVHGNGNSSGSTCRAGTDISKGTAQADSRADERTRCSFGRATVLPDSRWLAAPCAATRARIHRGQSGGKYQHPGVSGDRGTVDVSLRPCIQAISRHAPSRLFGATPRTTGAGPADRHRPAAFGNRARGRL